MAVERTVEAIMNEVPDQVLSEEHAALRILHEGVVNLDTAIGAVGATFSSASSPFAVQRRTAVVHNGYLAEHRRKLLQARMMESAAQQRTEPVGSHTVHRVNMTHEELLAEWRAMRRVGKGL
eukprot:PhF_6_TR37810/c0_g1_i3/m.56295